MGEREVAGQVFEQWRGEWRRVSCGCISKQDAVTNNEVKGGDREGTRGEIETRREERRVCEGKGTC